MAYFAGSVLLSAFLLLQVQPLISKYILPWFGGTPAMWSAALLFFQTLLLVGNAYVYGLTGRLKPRQQGFVHLVLLGASLGLLLVLALLGQLPPILPPAAWKPQGEGWPVWQVLRILAVAVGLPYLVLSTNSPLMQSWAHHRYPGRSPYRLYALSNLGSLLGLLAYPFLIEPLLGLRTQAILWTGGYVCCALYLGYGAIRMLRPVPDTPAPRPQQRAERRPRGRIKVAPVRTNGQCPACRGSAAAVSQRGTTPPPRAATVAGHRPAGASDLDTAKRRPSLGAGLLWTILAAAASVVLLATTNHITQEVAVLPFLWVVPLALYLLSFILSFSSERWYARPWYAAAFLLSTGLFCWVLYYRPDTVSIGVQIGIYCLELFLAGMICHGELARIKPAPRYLAGFYLLVAAGGALGGAAVNLVAPAIFSGFWELPLGLLLCWLLLGGFSVAGWSQAKRPRLAWLNDAVMAAGVAVLGVTTFLYIDKGTTDVLLAARSFYGVVRVAETERGDPPRQVHELLYSGTVHGLQYTDPDRQQLPTAYYVEDSGVGLAIAYHPRRPAGLRVGVIGLGVGTLAAYGRPEDTLRFYEINPDVIRLAQGEGGFFTYLQDSPAQIEIVPGDARLSLEKEWTAGDLPPLDLLVVDAFNGGAIPLHLLTAEALDIYLGRLQPDGILALHISNPYLELSGVVQGLADYAQMGTLFIRYPGDEEGGLPSLWALMTRDEAFLRQPELAGRAGPRPAEASVRLWTDDRSDLLQVLGR
jgi:hypothetical protein